MSESERLTRPAIVRAARQYPLGTRLRLAVAADAEDTARRALRPETRLQTGDERRRPGVQDGVIDGRHIDIAVDVDLEDGAWSVEEASD